MSAIGQTARSRPIKWAPIGKPTTPSGDPVSVSIRLWPRLQRGLFFGEVTENERRRADASARRFSRRSHQRNERRPRS